jgi:pimeloyl-ACP methyl ester carboxylesterase
LLDDLEIERAPVAGASFGAWVALQLATLAPERVSALALFAATLADSEQWSPEIEAYWAKEEELLQAGDIDAAVELGVRTWVRDPATAQLVADMSRAGFEAQLGVEAPERELGVELSAIAVPTLAVDGGLDLPDWAPMADRIAAAIPGAQRATVADAGHLIALERPDAAAELLAGLLERVGA